MKTAIKEQLATEGDQNLTCNYGSRKRTDVPNYGIVSAADIVCALYGNESIFCKYVSGGLGEILPNALIDVQEFCNSPPNPPDALNIVDFFGTGWVGKAIDIAKAQKWNEWCECIPPTTGEELCLRFTVAGFDGYPSCKSSGTFVYEVRGRSYSIGKGTRTMYNQAIGCACDILYIDGRKIDEVFPGSIRVIQCNGTAAPLPNQYSPPSPPVFPPDAPSPISFPGRGPAGPAGPAGPRGLTGATGAQGLQGVKGDKGDNGATGSSGPQGPKGDTGTKGYTPIKGVDYYDGQPGRDGSNGRDGYTPIKGIDYTDGDRGERGEPGERGYTPIKGVDYFDGERGSTGYVGPPGRDGVDGYTPKKGVDYFDGLPGPKGEDAEVEFINLSVPINACNAEGKTEPYTAAIQVIAGNNGSESAYALTLFNQLQKVTQGQCPNDNVEEDEEKPKTIQEVIKDFQGREFFDRADLIEARILVISFPRGMGRRYGYNAPDKFYFGGFAFKYDAFEPERSIDWEHTHCIPVRKPTGVAVSLEPFIVANIILLREDRS